jgi:hypothetical protein
VESHGESEGNILKAGDSQKLDMKKSDAFFGGMGGGQGFFPAEIAS